MTNGTPATDIVPDELVQQALAATAPQPLPAPALRLIADIAAQSPLVAQWISGWLTAQGTTEPTPMRLVIDAAHLELTTNA